MDNSPPAANLRSKSRRALAEQQNGATPSSAAASSTRRAATTPTRRNPPYLPTPVEAALLALFPALLLFGTAYSLLSPQVRRAAYDPTTQSHAQHPSEAPGYFARKNNVFNVVYVKRGWFWTTVVFGLFVATHPALQNAKRRMQAGVRWAVATALWFLVTQWCFGPAIIDRSFRWTGGRCEVVEGKVQEGDADVGEFVSAVACKAAGGAWRGGHDISGHVFLLVLASGFLLQEVGWAYLRHRGVREERAIVMSDGAVKSAGVESEGGVERADLQEDSLGLGGKAALVAIALSSWMLLMTAIYFHTWFEKFTGLLTAISALYTLYVLPRFMPALRQVVGLPGV
ncbi:conserved hypothetical protein [Verticillium alfalfae VaMs.102]|uniref:Acyl-coenzyme A diphosphatase SCS3 n=1 Tax=Verticillium alfalfae (strain VaMs.102 / ATCC MYA-4576 / FGSC 10136) TaxID=526221 RepID=C9SDM1_VERA1|nr:conserved hypothetical protein [Verticillium alfalfae VaMs.102]EEY16442.1 conserved hypothetical protein [Verticillium alfalfae VaMs.102]